MITYAHHWGTAYPDETAVRSSLVYIGYLTKIGAWYKLYSLIEVLCWYCFYNASKIVETFLKKILVFLKDAVKITANIFCIVYLVCSPRKSYISELWIRTIWKEHKTNYEQCCIYFSLHINTSSSHIIVLCVYLIINKPLKVF